MKINPNLEFSQLPSFVRGHLMFHSPLDIKWSLGAFVILLYDLPLLFVLLTLMKVGLLWLFLPFILILNVWYIRILIKNPYSTQLESVGFMGAYGICGTITFFIIMQVIPYELLNTDTILYYVIMNALTLSSMYFIIRNQIVKYRNINYGDESGKRRENKQSKYTGILVVVPVIGYFLGQNVSRSSLFEYFYTIGISFFFTLLSVYIGAKFVHKYFFMKANMNYVRYEKPSKQEKKELSNKGVVIK